MAEPACGAASPSGLLGPMAMVPTLPVQPHKAASHVLQEQKTLVPAVKADESPWLSPGPGLCGRDVGCAGELGA